MIWKFLAGIMIAGTLFSQTPKGTVFGTLFDAQTSRPIIGVTIYIDGQSTDALKSGADGTFRVELSPGKYKLKFVADNYLELEVTAVEVKAGEAVDASAVLSVKGTSTTVESAIR